MNEAEPIVFRPSTKGTTSRPASYPPAISTGRARSQQTPPPAISFDRLELNQILALYGRKVAAGDWRDYALCFGKDKAVFSVFRRTSECPLYHIEKSPKLARRQGAYALVSAHGLILKRGRDLRRVLAFLDRSLRLVERAPSA